MLLCGDLQKESLKLTELGNNIKMINKEGCVDRWGHHPAVYSALFWQVHARFTLPHPLEVRSGFLTCFDK